MGSAGSKGAAGSDDRGVDLTRYAWLSIAAAITTMTLKSVAYLITGSVGLLSDAVESVVNLVAAVVALVVLHIAAKPPDERHEHGHEKAEYFSAGVEGAMIVVAALSIFWVSFDRLLHPVALERLGAGLAVSTVAALVNLCVSVVLTRAGHRYRSITLEADGKHLMTDVWTSAGVLVAVGAVALTGWDRLDPTIAILVGANVLFAGWVLLRRSTSGLMDESLPTDERRSLEEVLERHAGIEVQFHAVRTRQSGRRSFMSMHVLVPGRWTVQQGHDLVERVETDLRQTVPDLMVIAHLEPLEDPRSFSDEGLGRLHTPPSAALRPDEAPGGSTST